MQVFNALPHFLRELEKWQGFPDAVAFARYLDPLRPQLGPMLADFQDYRGFEFYSYLQETVGADADAWGKYRRQALRLDPAAEEARVREQITRVEKLLGGRLAGEAFLFGSLTLMDGYARFDRGTHRVYLGVDEDFANGNYLDILISHELTHVARESRPAVWEGWGLSPRMTHDEFVASYPALEHLFNEGFACVVSEAAHPEESKPWKFVYQSEASWRGLLQPDRLAALDQKIHAVLRDPSRSYREFYDTSAYGAPMPEFAHYTWAWAWAKSVCAGRSLAEVAGEPSRNWLDSALAFRLESALAL